VWLVVIVLYAIGGEGVHLFDRHGSGRDLGTYSSIYIASPLLLIFGEGTTGTTDSSRRSRKRSARRREIRWGCARDPPGVREYAIPGDAY